MRRRIIQVVVVSVFAWVAAATTASSIEGNGPRRLDPTPSSFARDGRSLLQEFPFGQDHGDHAGHHEGKFSRQKATDEAIDIIGEAAASGQRCVEKVMMVEETKYDDAIECHHSYDKSCHVTYTTNYVPQQIEDCDENFVKECHIEYKKVAFNETVEICNQRPVRDCDQEGETVCETVYESERQTTYSVHEVEEDTPKCEIQYMEKCRDVTQGYSTKEECDKWPQQVCELEKNTVKRYSPETQCEKKPRKVCGPGPCPIVAGPKECRKDLKTVIQEVPKETCSLKAQPYCEFQTKLVPVLKPVENCVDVPKEVCVRMRTNPRKVKRPVIKKWCYTPTEDTGSVVETTVEPDRETSTTVDEGSTTTSGPSEIITEAAEETDAETTALPSETEAAATDPVARSKPGNKIRRRQQ